MPSLSRSILSDARSHVWLTAVATPLVGWFAGGGGLAILAASAGLVLAVMALSRWMVSLAAPAKASPVFTMVAGAASRMLLVVGLIVVAFEAHLLGLSEQDIKLFGVLTIPFYLLQLALEIQSARKVFGEQPVSRSLRPAC